jgi:hypothetical protein
VPKDPPAGRLDRLGRAWIGLTFLLASVFRITLVFLFPTIHGGDAAARIAHADTLVLGYQLPLPQAFVVLGKGLADDPLLVRLIFSIWGGILASGFTALVALGLGSRAALFAGLLLSFDPLTTHYSVVPYQEPVAYGLLAWAFVAASLNRPGLGGLLLAAACLSRYEAWMFVPVFAIAFRSWKGTLIALAPIAGWVLWWRGLAPGGLYVLDLDPSAGRFSRIVYLGSKLIEYETIVPLVLAAAGLLIALRTSNRWVLSLAAAFVVPIAVTVGLGHEFPPGSGLMSERLIHLPVLLLLSLSAFVLDRMNSVSQAGSALALALALLLTGRNVRFEGLLLGAAAQDPDLALARETARAVETQRSNGECISVSAPAVDRGLLLGYVSKVAASGGDVARARERAEALAGTSPDRDRIAAHLKAPAGTIRSEDGCPLLVEVDDVRFDPARAVEGSQAAVITVGPRRARVLRTRP